MHHFDTANVDALLKAAGIDATVIVVDPLRGPAPDGSLVNGRVRCHVLALIGGAEQDIFIAVYRAKASIQPGPLMCEIAMGARTALYALSNNAAGEWTLRPIAVHSPAV